MVYLREFHKGGRVYYAQVESYRDAQGRPRQRLVKWQGTRKTPPPDPIEVRGVDFAELAVKLMDESLTADDVFRFLDEIGKRPVEVKELDGIGIRFDLGQKKLVLYVFPKGYTWKVVPPRARPAKAASAGKGRASGRASSRSKATSK